MTYAVGVPDWKSENGGSTPPLSTIYKSKGVKIMNEIEILTLENRIALLRGRTGRENGKIIRKLERRLRKLNSSK